VSTRLSPTRKLAVLTPTPLSPPPETLMHPPLTNAALTVPPPDQTALPVARTCQERFPIPTIPKNRPAAPRVQSSLEVPPTLLAVLARNSTNLPMKPAAPPMANIISSLAQVHSAAEPPRARELVTPAAVTPDTTPSPTFAAVLPPAPSEKATLAAVARPTTPPSRLAVPAPPSPTPSPVTSAAVPSTTTLLTSFVVQLSREKKKKKE